MKLNQRQKDILLNLISNEIEDIIDDAEHDEKYFDELEDLAEIIFKANSEASKK